MLSARLRASPSAKFVVMIDSAAGAVKAAAAPLIRRVATSRVGSLVAAPSSDAKGGVPRRGPGRGRDGEDRHGDEKAASAPEQIGGAPPEEQQPAVAEDVA